ncbi:MAG TPA: glycosyl hydrolase family 28-related protein [Terracidiphilus sp.]|nr:glycosyl hydrolase family 28-related protein [Terracidiphilus sp.]
MNPLKYPIQVRRGLASKLATITPPQGEPCWTTDTKQLFVGDGATLGAIPVNPMVNVRQFGAKGDGITDDTAAIQAAAIAGAGGEVLFSLPGTYLVNGPVLLDSHTTVRMAPGVVIRLGDVINTPIFRNRHWTTAMDTDIAIIGGKLDGNHANNTIASAGGTYGLIGAYGLICFINVTRPKVSGVTIYNGTPFGIQLAACLDIVVEDIHFDTQFRDGVHLNGPITGGIIRRITGDTADDFIALNAWDWTNYSPELGGVPTSGSITGLHLSDINGVSPGLLIRMMSGTSAQVTDIVVDGLHGTGGNGVINSSLAADADIPAHTTTATKIDRIVLRDVDAIATSNTSGLGQQLYFGLAGTIRIENFTARANPNGRSNIRLGGGAVDALIFNGVTNKEDMLADFLEVVNGASVAHVQMNNVRIVNAAAKDFGRHLINSLGTLALIDLCNLYLKNITDILNLGQASNAVTLNLANYTITGCYYGASLSAASDTLAWRATNGTLDVYALVHVISTASVYLTSTGQYFSFATVSDSSGAVRINAPELHVDSSVLTPTAGDQVYQTNGTPGNVIYNGSNWISLW